MALEILREANIPVLANQIGDDLAGKLFLIPAPEKSKNASIEEKCNATK
jgi:hypothetical protein